MSLWNRICLISDYAMHSTYIPLDPACSQFISPGVNGYIERMGPADTSTPAIVLASGYIIHNYTVVEKMAEAKHLYRHDRYWPSIHNNLWRVYMDFV